LSYSMTTNPSTGDSVAGASRGMRAPSRTRSRNTRNRRPRVFACQRASPLEMAAVRLDQTHAASSSWSPPATRQAASSLARKRSYIIANLILAASAKAAVRNWAFDLIASSTQAHNGQPAAAETPNLEALCLPFQNPKKVNHGIRFSRYRDRARQRLSS
jgi:hypothetical protein